MTDLRTNRVTDVQSPKNRRDERGKGEKGWVGSKGYTYRTGLDQVISQLIIMWWEQYRNEQSHLGECGNNREIGR